MNLNKQKNKKEIKNTFISKMSGFTLIETMVAVFILTIALTSLLSLTASSLFSARYSRNEITANYLLQEAADYIRNQRDTIAFQQILLPEGGWDQFLNKFGGIGGPCFSEDGCYFDVNNNDLVIGQECDLTPTFGELKCPVFYYDQNAFDGSFYNYTSHANLSNFKRKIFLETASGGDELYITVTVEWLNGKLVRSRSLYISLLNWFKIE